MFEADKGSNLFFVIYVNIETGDRIIDKTSSIPLIDAIDRKANGLPIADEKEGYINIILSPNDLVYIPEEEELERIKAKHPNPINWENKKRIGERVYKVMSFSKSQIFFIPHYVSKPLDEKGQELGANNKSETSWEKVMIKKCCIKIKVDRLGNIKPL